MNISSNKKDKGGVSKKHDISIGSLDSVSAAGSGRAKSARSRMNSEPKSVSMRSKQGGMNKTGDLSGNLFSLGEEKPESLGIKSNNLDFKKDELKNSTNTS